MTYKKHIENCVVACNGKRVSDCNRNTLRELINSGRAYIENGIVKCTIYNSETKKFVKHYRS